MTNLPDSPGLTTVHKAMHNRPLALASMAMLLFGCARPHTTQTVVVPTMTQSSTAETPPKLFNPKVALSPRSSLEVRVKTALADDRPDRAQQLVESGLRQAPAHHKARLHWLAATAAFERGDVDAGIGHLTTVSHLPDPLARWAQLRVAALLESRDPGAAAELAAALTDDWTGQRQARLLEAEALAAEGKPEAAIPKLRALVAEAPKEVGAASAGMPLAELLEARGDLASKEEAFALYQRVATRAPLTRVGEEARNRAKRLLATFPPSRRKELGTVESRFAEARAFFQARRYDKAETVLVKLVKSLPADDARRCEARLMRGKAVLRMRDRDRGAPLMESVARKCTDPDIKAWARYYAGRAYGRLGQWSDAIAQYEALELEAPDHRLADDARFRTALAELERGKTKAAMRRLRSIPDRYPDGDMWPEALFRVAWAERQKRRYTSALTHLNDLIDRGGGEHEEGVMGRALYWRGRTLHDLDRDQEAIQSYAETAERWPLRYYAQQALARLRELEPKRAKAIEEMMRDDSVTQVLVFTWHPSFDTDAFKRAIELLRVDEYNLATKEMDALGMLGKQTDPRLTLVAAALLREAGAQPRLSRLIRRHFQQFPGLRPTGEGRAVWELAYPRAFKPLIEKTARRESLPPAFVRAIAREESSFDPQAVSSANAYGLVQLILPTAKRFGNKMGLRVTPRTLKRPSTNLRIGARYMAWLWERFEKNPALVPSAYNAGEGAVRRWLREKPRRTLDVFIEEIPYEETRRYTRRVLQTYGVYSWLGKEELPPLPRSLPNPS